jgi:glycosyltransferase involved in cell wall biosynthesis
VDGFLCSQDPQDIADHIIQVLLNEQVQIKMGIMARKKIIDNFDDKKRINPILSLITNYEKPMSLFD